MMTKTKPITPEELAMQEEARGLREREQVARAKVARQRRELRRLNRLVLDGKGES